MTRRDEILADMHGALRARRRRSLAARTAAGATPVLALAAAWTVMHRQAQPVEPGASAPPYRHLRVALIEPAGRVETISDDELIELLGRAGRKAGYVRTPDRFVLTGDPLLANERPDTPPDDATVRP